MSCNITKIGTINHTQRLFFHSLDIWGWPIDNCRNWWIISISLKIQIILPAYLLLGSDLVHTVWRVTYNIEEKNSQQEKINANNNEMTISWNATLRKNSRLFQNSGFFLLLCVSIQYILFSFVIDGVRSNGVRFVCYYFCCWKWLLQQQQQQ